MIDRHQPSEEPPATTTLLLVGDTEFTVDDAGRLHTLVALSKQLDVWFAEFDQVTIAAHLRAGPPPADHRRIESLNISLIPLPKAGGMGFRAKLNVGVAMLTWVKTLIPLLHAATAVHLRAPCNVTLVVIPLARLLAPRRYAIYADNWEPLGVEPYTYRLQRLMLRYLGGIVHAYIPPEAPRPPHIRPNVSPVFSSDELAELSDSLEQRCSRTFSDPVATRAIRICCVGSLSERKNQETLIRSVELLTAKGISVQLRIAGDGPRRGKLQALVAELGITENVRFCGHLGRVDVQHLFEWADVNVLVSNAEGYGKVFLEGMAVGCPAICGPGLMQASIVGSGTRGLQIDPPRPAGVAGAIEYFVELPTDQYIQMVHACRTFVASHTIEEFSREVQYIIHDMWGLGGNHSADG